MLLPMNEIRPLADRVVVRPMPEDRVLASGIVIPDVAAEKPQTGVVVAAGSGSVTKAGARVAPEVFEGDRVLYSKYGGTEIRVDGEDLIVLREADVIARFV
jgi:chaperonin GroES